MAKIHRCDYCFKRLKNDESMTNHYYSGTCTRARDDIKKGKANKNLENLTKRREGLRVRGTKYSNQLHMPD